jgi:hypothetical protein
MLHTRRMAESATYVYCVVKCAKAPNVGRGAPKGLAKTSELRVLDAGDGYRLVVASAPLSIYRGEAIDAKLRDIDWVAERAAEHESMVEHFAGAGTLVPMKLFTLFATDERAVDHVARMRRTLDRVVERIAGCEEWGLRILFDETKAARAEPPPKVGTSGTGFLLRKKAQQEQRRTLAARAAAEVDDLFERLEKIARRSVRRAAPNRELAGRVLLDAVFLVPEKSTKKLKAEVAKAGNALAGEGFHVTLTGPWPAYSFIGATR